jgi:hypothetical protein
MVLVKGGEHDLQLKARLYNRLVEGAFEQLGVYDKDSQWCRDAARKGCGWAYVDEDGEEPVILRCDPYSILIDDLEWAEGQGRVIHWIRLRAKNDLLDEYPEFKEKIEAASIQEFPHLTRYLRGDEESNMCPVAYSWARKIGDKPGMVVCSLPGAVLEADEWESENLPFAWLTRTPAEVGVWGEPLMADLVPIQETYDRYMHRIDESMWLTNVIRLLVRRGAKVNKSKLPNLPATLLEVTDPDHDIRSFNAEISPQLFQFVSQAKELMQELSRSSLLATTGQVQPNLRSASALRIAEDTDVEGLREGLRSRDSFYVRIAQLLIEAFDRLGAYKMMVKVGKRAEQISYKKVKLPKGTYIWTVMPTSFLAKTPEGRMDQAEWLVEQGLLPKDRIAHFIDFPDLESETALAMAQYDAIMHRIDLILNEGKVLPPHPMLNLVLLRKLVGDAVARAEADGAPEDKIQMLRDLIVAAENLQQMAEQPQNPMQALMGAAGAQPGAQPGAPPGVPPAGTPPSPPIGP